ncbi:hypothetical protein [Streptomyces canus]|uniref:hypothetical protein n=1 Tax=Streptomyces canus TaxID=58343 RepID=UPI002E36C7DF|nr:hypothetical protein [Streptomyces canus]
MQRTSLEVGLADPLPEGLADIREDLLAMNRDAEKLIASLLQPRGRCRSSETWCCCAIW